MCGPQRGTAHSERFLIHVSGLFKFPTLLMDFSHALFDTDHVAMVSTEMRVDGFEEFFVVGKGLIEFTSLVMSLSEITQ